MWSRINGITLGLVLFSCIAVVPSGMAAPPLGATETWPTEITPAEPYALIVQQARIDALAKILFPELAPAVRFQKAFLTATSGAPETAWADEMRRLAAATGEDGATRGLREAARYWVARLEMKQIGEVLRGFYIREIRFPENFSLIEADLPEAIRRDPWGDPWAYKVKTPDRFNSLEGQGYQLGPGRLPSLSLLRDVRKARRASVPAWKIKSATAGGHPALEFRSPAATALIQPGGLADGCTLLYIGTGWALMSQVDQLFAITF